MKFGSFRVNAGGRVFEVPLDEPSLIVGTEAGSGVELADASVASRHARLVFDSGRLTVEDLGSPSGTYLNGVRLQPHTIHVVGDGQSLRFGNVEAGFREPGHASLPTSEPAFAAAGPALLRVAVQPPAGPVTPGQPAVIQVSVQNRSRVVDQVSLAVSGVSPAWVTIPKPTFSLLPDQSEESTIVVTVPREAGAPAGAVPFSVVAQSRQGHAASAPVTMNVLPFEALSMTLEPQASDRTFRLIARNGGNTPQTFALAGSDDEMAFSYTFDPPALVVPPGGEATVRVQVAAGGRPMSGPEQRPQFKIKATSTAGAGEQQTFGGTLIVRPRFKRDPRKVLTAALALAAIAAAAAFIPFCLGGDKDGSVPATPTSQVLKPGEEPTVHMCGDGTADPPAGSSTTPEATQTPVVVTRAGAGADPGGPLFAQNDARWGNDEYARAQDPEFGPDWCGSTIAQCGCAMTSVATILSLYQVTVIPEGTALSPESLNAWFNGDAVKTSRGWVSRGYVFGDVVWSAGGALSGQVAALNPGSPKVRFVRSGNGSDDEIRKEMAEGRAVILAVPGHWIAVAGLEGNRIRINDPYYADRVYLDAAYPGKVLSSRIYESSEDLSAIVVTVTADQRVKITDSNGRVVGTNAKGTPEEAAKGAKREVAGASYAYEAAWRDPNCIESLPPPGAGTNQIVIPRPGGKYKVEVVDPNGKPVVAVHTIDKDGKITISVVEEDEFVIDVPKAAVTPGPTTPATVSVTPTTPATVPTTATAVTPTTPPTTVAPVVTTVVTTTGTTVTPPKVGIACRTAPDGAAVVMTCDGTVEGTATSTYWEVNGVRSATVGLVFANRFTVTSRPLVVFNACNAGACSSASQSVIVDVPTPTPTVNPGPTSGTISCTSAIVSGRAEIKCTESFNGAYDAVQWTATNASPLTATTAPKAGWLTYGLPGVVTVTAKGCLGTKCVEANKVSFSVSAIPVTILLDMTSGQHSAAAVASIIPFGARGTFRLYAAKAPPSTSGAPPSSAYTLIFSCNYPASCPIGDGLMFIETGVTTVYYYYASFTPEPGTLWSSYTTAAIQYDY